MPNLIAVGQTVQVYRKNMTLASRFSRSSKVIESDTDQSGTYDFLSMFHSNHVPALHHFCPVRAPGL